MAPLLAFLLLAVDLPAPLQRVLGDYEKAWSAKDAAALADLFAEDGFVLSSGHPPVAGRAAIRQFYGGKGGPLYLTALAWSAHGDTGYIIGTYTHRPGAAPSGKFTLTLVKQRNRWLIKSDMDNQNQR